VLALDDLGGTPLHVVHDGTTSTVLARAGLLPAELVRDGIVADLKAVLFATPRPDDAVVACRIGGADRIGLLRRDGRERTLYWSSSAPGSVDRIHRGQGQAQPTEYKLR
jgi:hypothetical protein